PGKPEGVVVWLHGLGADGHDFEPVVPILGLPRARFVFPHAPRGPVTINGGVVMPAWYDIVAIGGDGAKEEDVRRSAKQLRALLEREEKNGVPADRIILAGFSQGGAMALHVGTRYPRALRGIMVLSGYEVLPPTRERDATPANRTTPMLCCHGTAEPLVAAPPRRRPVPGALRDGPPAPRATRAGPGTAHDPRGHRPPPPARPGRAARRLRRRVVPPPLRARAGPVAAAGAVAGERDGHPAGARRRPRGPRLRRPRQPAARGRGEHPALPDPLRHVRPAGRARPGPDLPRQPQRTAVHCGGPRVPHRRRPLRIARPEERGGGPAGGGSASAQRRAAGDAAGRAAAPRDRRRRPLAAAGPRCV